jgi:hypothetical protein
MFSTNSKEIVINPLHCRIPLVNLPIGTWINLSIDVLGFVSECFKSQTFRSIDFISLTANCKVRRIFSMRSGLMEANKTNINDEFFIEYGNILPKNLAMPNSVTCENINVNMEKIKVINDEMKSSQENYGMIPKALNKNKESVYNFRNSYGLNNLNNHQQNVKIQSNIRSKSHNKIMKNKNIEITNKQELIELNKSPKESISPLVKKKDNRIVKNRPNRFINIPKQNNKINKNSESNIKNIDSLSTTPKGESENRLTHTNPMLLNTLNYRNFDKWEVTKDNGGDSIEEIFDFEEKKVKDFEPIINYK